MELISTTTAFLSALMLILVSFLAHKARGKSMKKRRPPGPLALPFVGCIHHLLTSQPQAALRDLAQKHGPVMYLKLGQVDTVVISSPTAAQEALREKDLSLASRPSLLGSEIICYGNRDIAFAPYGDYWRSLRKMCTVELLNASKVRQFAAIRDSETMSLVREIRCAAAATTGGAEAEPVNLGGLLLSCSNSITGRAAFGNRCSSELKADFLSAISVVISNISGFCVSDLFPSLRFMDALTGTKRRLWRAHQQLEDVFGRIISDGEVRREERMGTTAGEDDDDLLSVMLRIRDEGGFEIPINNTNIKGIILVNIYT
jgi:cytochrome P450